MPELRVEAGYVPNPKQRTFHLSRAFIRGYGGAMGGGKSRAICEEAFRLALHKPGLVTLICRDAHTSIVQTTKKTMVEQVIPTALLEHCDSKASGGEDWLRLPNGSIFHFIGLDDPVRWFSSEIGLLIFDEAHEVLEDTVSKLVTRLRQRCKDCIRDELEDCPHMPNRAIIAFNPENPGHWLFKWFIQGGTQTEHGFYKKHFFLPEAEESIGDTEFVFANVHDNKFVGQKYMRMLRGLPQMLRERYLEGKWVYISGKCFFDTEALGWYQGQLQQPRHVGKLDCCTAWPACECDGIGGRPRFRSDKAGEWAIWDTPVRARVVEDRLLPEHRYIVSVDVSSGGSRDYSAIQVISVEDFAQVAEFQGKADPDQIAVQAARIGRIYNDALVAPEVTGGWGFSVVKELQRLKYRRLYTRPIEDRLSRKFTDKVGWDTTTKSRAVMLDTLERALREREFVLNGQRTHHELASFVRDEAGRPAAQPGANDDMVIALAIGVTLASQLPRQLRRVKEPEYQPSFASTGF